MPTSSDRTGIFSAKGGASRPSLSFWAILLFFLAIDAGERYPTDRLALTGGGIVRDGVFLPAFRTPEVRYDRYLTRTVFVRFDHDISPDEAIRTLYAAGAVALRDIPRTRNTYLVTGKAPSLAFIDRLADLPGVRHAEPDSYRPISRRVFSPDDPLFPNQWHLENTGQTGTGGDDARVAAAWRYLMDRELTPGRGVTVGVIDDGFDLAHPDMRGAFLRGIDLYDGDDDPLFGPGDLHGTAVTGVLAARWNNGIGVAGACPGCLVVPVRVSGALLSGETEIDAFNYLLDRGVDIISNSWGPMDRGGPVDISDPLKEIFAWAVEKGRDGKGVVILFAAGNGNEDISDPRTLDGYAANPWVIAVGATNASGIKTMYSDFGADLDLMAPSCDIDPDDYYDPFDIEKIRDGIWTTDNGGISGYSPGDYTPGFCGTSSATPLAAGIVGLLLGADPDLSWDDIYAILTATADKVSPGDARYDEQGFSPRYGYGRVNALAALQALCETGECPGAPPIDEEPIDPPDRDIEFVEDMTTVTDDDTPLAPEEPVAGGCGLVLP